jgi:hypothetical protein
MVSNVIAVIGSIAVVLSLFGALYVWFEASLRRYNGVVAKDVLASWDAELAQLPPYEREELRMQPPVEVLEAITDSPSPRLSRSQLSWTQ